MSSDEKKSEEKFEEKKKSKYSLKNKTKYNLRFDKHQPSDHRYSAPLVKLPKKIDLTQKLPKEQTPYDQGNIGSCTANSTIFCYTFNEIKQKNDDTFMGSRMFQYYNTRKLFGDVESDNGASIKDAIKSLTETGICTESLWPYDESKIFDKPPKKCYEQAKECKALKYARVDQTLAALRTTLYNGYPIAFGFQVYESFESDKVEETGIMPIPSSDELQIGGHAVAMVGYDDTKKMFKVRNSWGNQWGDGGYFWMPYKFALDPKYCDDFWVITKVTDPDIIPGKTVELQPIGV